jgi:hypothetical protein
LSRQIWIANVEVIPLPGNIMFDSPAAGGFVNAIAYAGSADEFVSSLAKSLSEYGVRLKAIQRLRPLTDVLAGSDTEPRLFDEALLLKDEEVRYGTLHTYAQNDEE